MRSKILALMMLAAFSFFFIFGGCGNGGGGNGGGGSGGLSYTGETAPAEINQDNAVDIAAGAFAGGKTGTLQYATGLPVDNFRYYKVPQILRDAARSMDLSPYLHNLSSNADTVYTETVTVEGTCGGSFDYTVTKNDVSGEFEGTFSFFYYCDHCVAINGDVDFEGWVDPVSGDIITITFWFDKLSDGTMTMDGEISMDFSGSPIICTLDTLLKDETTGTTGNVYWAKNYRLNISELEGNAAVEIFGTFYHPDYGYVPVDTGTGSGLFQIQPWSELPWIGWLEMGGANGTKARLLASYQKCQITADTDGDGVYDWNSGELNWSKPAIDPANWMRDLGDHIKTLKIKNVVLPGTHDSGTYSQDWGDYIVYPWVHCFMVKGSLRAQNHNIQEQLNEGIRYFDLRYQWQGGGSVLTETNLVIWHGHCHTTNDGQIQNAITWVKEFVQSHPKEIVILDLNSWSFMDGARHRAAAKYIVEQLGEYMVPWNIGKEFGQKPINFASPDVTVQEIWEAEKSVIVIYRTNDWGGNKSEWYSPQLDDPLFFDNPDYNNLFWGGELTKTGEEFTEEPIIVSPWPNTDKLSVLEREMKTALKCRSAINDVLLECQPPDAHDKLFVLQSQLTGDPKDIGDELYNLAKKSNPIVIQWLQEWTTIGDELFSPEVAREHLNIVIVDFYELGRGVDIHNSCRDKSFVETIVELNLNRASVFIEGY